MGILTGQVSWYRYRDDGEAYMGQGATLEWGLDGYEPICDVVAFGDAQGAQGDESTIPYGAGPPANSKPDPDAGERTKKIQVDGGYPYVEIHDDPLFVGGKGTAKLVLVGFDEGAALPAVQGWYVRKVAGAENHGALEIVRIEGGHNHGGATQVPLKGINAGTDEVIATLMPPTSSQSSGSSKAGEKGSVVTSAARSLGTTVAALAGCAMVGAAAKVKHADVWLEIVPLAGKSKRHGSAELYYRNFASASRNYLVLSVTDPITSKPQAHSWQLLWDAKPSPGERAMGARWKRLKEQAPFPFPPTPQWGMPVYIPSPLPFETSTGDITEKITSSGRTVRLVSKQRIELAGGWSRLWQPSATFTYAIFLKWLPSLEGVTVPITVTGSGCVRVLIRGTPLGLGTGGPRTPKERDLWLKKTTCMNNLQAGLKLRMANPQTGQWETIECKFTAPISSRKLKEKSKEFKVKEPERLYPLSGGDTAQGINSKRIGALTNMITGFVAVLGKRYEAYANVDDLSLTLGDPRKNSSEGGAQ